MTAMATNQRDWRAVARMIDHTVLKTDARRLQIEQICREALEYQFASVCIQPSWVEFATELLRGSQVKVCTVIGFPQGATTTNTKVFETVDALKRGAQELDMVINVGALKDADTALVELEIRSLAAVTHESGA